MHRAFSLLAVTALIAAPGASLANPNSPPTSPTTTSSPFGHTGQPDVECEDFGDDSRPGQAMFAPGSAFNPDGTAGTHYAGNQPGINDKNEHSVSQYDVGCARNQSPIG